MYDFMFGVFHWGPDNSVGSEHAINGTKYPLELQFWHRKSEHSKHVDDQWEQFIVVSILFELSSEDNKDLDRILTHVERSVKFDGQSKSVKLILISLFPEERDNYFVYNGSQTLPWNNCSEDVIWVVYESVNKVSFTILSFLLTDVSTFQTFLLYSNKVIQMFKVSDKQMKVIRGSLLDDDNNLIKSNYR